MASITFPEISNEQQSSSEAMRESFFGSTFGQSSASFQHNPLSPHPPRTPRTSIVANARQSFGLNSDMFHSTLPHSLEEDTKETLNAADVDIEEDRVIPEDVEELADEGAVKKVKAPHVLQEMLRTSSGRDTAFKVLQYTIRVYLLFHSSISSNRLFSKRKKTQWELELVKRLELTASGLSAARSTLIMFNWLAPLNSILASRDEDLVFSEQPSKEKNAPKPLLHTFLHAPPPALLDLVGGFSDDICAFHRLGLLGRKAGDTAGRFTNWCWFLGTLIALVELSFERSVTKSKIQAVESNLYSNSTNNTVSNRRSATEIAHEKELEKLRKQEFWLRIQKTKLLLDLLFVSYDIFKIKRMRNVVQPFAGLGAAILSAAKHYHNHRTTLVLKETRR